MRFYKLNGVWQSWDYLHNELGYAEHETRPTVFKSCADATWGEDAGNGYYDGDVNDMINGTFWTDADPTGWFSLNGLVWNSETYPADATPSLLVKDGVASDALVITCDDGNYYLIRAIIDTTAWIPESEVEALGWRSPSFVVVDSTTGKVVSGCNQELDVYELPSVVLNIEDGYETYELPSVSLPTPNVVIGVPITGPVQAFWFTDEGRAETSDKTFTVVGNPLFDEDGNVARNELYDSAVPLSFMRYDGNMFEADSDSDIVRYLPVTDRLVLSIPGDSTTRDKSAWSVQVAKLFVLSYANTQLPDVQIELPINEVGAYGTSITLPTIDGEYESGGKTWKPSAWDIGAFGSSYSLTADTVAHLVFEEVQQYQEITLYMQSGSKAVQRGVTSGYTEEVASSFCHQLYTDEACTIPWNGYDYSNDYEIGYYADGEFVRYAYQSILDLPDAITYEESESKVALIVLDTGYLWLCSNYTLAYNQSVTLSQITLRIYPKGQQYFAAYVYGSGTYRNAQLNKDTRKTCVREPGSTDYIQTPHQFPVITLQKILGAAGNELTLFQFFTYVGQDNSRFRIINKTIGSEVRTVIYTLEYPILCNWLKSDGTNLSTSSGVAYPLMNIGGEIVEFDDAFDYFPIALIQHNGGYATSTYSYLNNATMGAFDPEHPTRLCFKQISGTLSLSFVQYYKAPKSIRTTFGAAVTIPAGFKPVAVKCLKLFIKASSITKESGSTAPINFEYAGLENEFCTDTDSALFGVGVNPCINMYGFSNASNFSLFMLSTDSSQTGSSYAASVSASKFNKDGYFVKGVATLESNYNADTYAGYLQANPMMFVKYNQGVGLPFYFTIQSSMWSYENGVFSWLGNDTDTTDLAYWYKSAPDVQIILAKD